MPLLCTQNTHPAHPVGEGFLLRNNERAIQNPSQRPALIPLRALVALRGRVGTPPRSRTRPRWNPSALPCPLQHLRFSLLTRNAQPTTRNLPISTPTIFATRLTPRKSAFNGSYNPYKTRARKSTQKATASIFQLPASTLPLRQMQISPVRPCLPPSPRRPPPHAPPKPRGRRQHRLRIRRTHPKCQPPALSAGPTSSLRRP